MFHRWYVNILNVLKHTFFALRFVFVFFLILFAHKGMKQKFINSVWQLFFLAFKLLFFFNLYPFQSCQSLSIQNKSMFISYNKLFCYAHNFFLL